MSTYQDITLPVGHNLTTDTFEAHCPSCRTIVYQVSTYVAEAIGAPLPDTVPHTCLAA